MKSTTAAALALGAARALAGTLDVSLTSADSVKAASAQIAHNLLTYYTGNQPGMTPGILPGPPPAGPYYWWEAGAMWGTLVDYWHYTGDATYNSLTNDSILFQSVGSPPDAFMPQNWTLSLGNDDQGFWGMTAMLAAEVNFPNPPAGQPGWLTLAQGVWNTQQRRWDTVDCGGGLRWQIFSTNNGYDYKNTIPNAIFFNMGARLGRYTSNTTYLDWARQTWDWIVDHKYIDTDWNVYDGATIENNCTQVNDVQYSYNPAVLIQGAAAMWNVTTGAEQAEWEARLMGLLNRTADYFFPNGSLVERSCELEIGVRCTTDQLSFKGYVHRFLAQAAQMAPVIQAQITDLLTVSAKGAAAACNADGTCGFRWNTGSYDGDTGAGQEMSALGALISLLAPQTSAPVTNNTGGTSQGNPDAGSGSDTYAFGKSTSPLTGGPTAGAAFLTIFILLGGIATTVWMGSSWSEGGTEACKGLCGNHLIERAKGLLASG